MLHAFLAAHRERIVERARIQVATRSAPRATPAEIGNGVPLFLSQLETLLASEQRPSAGPAVATTSAAAQDALTPAASQVGSDMLHRGLTIAQVVEGYGDVCQAVLDEAAAAGVEISADEHRTLNLCLDVATAHAVTAFADERERTTERTSAERLGALAHELRNALATARLAFDSITRRGIGVAGNTGALLGRSLRALQDLVDRSLAEVRLAAPPRVPERIGLASVIEEVEIGAALDANARALQLEVLRVDDELTVTADRQLLASAVANLLQNALKFTRAGGRVVLSTHRDDAHVVIAVRDECGGLGASAKDALFRAFERHPGEGRGLGLGLKISRDAVRTMGGEIHCRDLPGEGCIFTVELPAAT